MLRTAVVEENKEKREMVKAALDSLNLDIQSVVFANPYDFKEKLDDGATSFDIIFLNTTLIKEGDGIELASFVRERNRKAMISFITDTQRYYAEAFEVFATGYLLYPFDVGKLYNIIQFFFSKNEHERRASWMLKESGGNYRRIFCRNVIYIESSNREIIVHLEDGSSISSYGKLDDVMAQLPSNLFLRCHQSYAISMYFVESVEHDFFHLKGDAAIPVSRKYQKISKEIYYDYIFEKV